MADTRQPRPPVRDSAPDEVVERKPWVRPEVTELPRLSELTLQTGSPIGGTGNTGSGGSTVF